MKTMRIRLAVFAAVLVLQAAYLNAGVTVVDGTSFLRKFETENTRFNLQGAALLRYLFFIDAYAGALYLPEGSEGAQALDDIPKHLVLEYRVAISADDLADATRERIKVSVDGDAFRRLLPGIESLNRLYRRVEPGDRYGITYIPGIGTRLIYNGVPLGTVPGAEFARAMFAIWIGDNPIDAGFRDRLLGKS